MRKIIYLILVAIVVVSCGVSQNTVANLREAANAQYVQSLEYQKFAQSKQLADFPQIQKMLQAFADARKIQYQILYDELKRSGDKKFEPSQTKITQDSLLEHLYKSMTSEQYELYNLLPEFIEMARVEKVDGAHKICEQLRQTKQNVPAYLSVAIQMLEQTTHSLPLTDTLPSSWAVCQKCGNVSADPQGYALGEAQGGGCSVCGNKLTN